MRPQTDDTRWRREGTPFAIMVAIGVLVALSAWGHARLELLF
jgi:hypothetical protein